MKTLVVKLSSLGDILHVLPAVLAIHEQTGSEIDWAVHPEFAGIVRSIKCVRRAIEIPRHRILESLGSALRELRSERYDMVVDLQGLAKSGIVSRLAKATRRIAPSYAREGSGLFFGERAGRMNRNRHAVIQAMDTVEYLGLRRETRATTADDFKLPQVERPAGNPLVALAPVSRWATKNWPIEKFLSFVRIFSEKSPGARYIVLGGRGDVEAGAAIADAAGGCAENLCGRCSIGESMALLAQSSLLVANDTGPVHMAAAVGTKCLVVFGATRPDWTGPWGEGHRTITAGLECQPCVKRRCRRGDLACLEAVAPEAVAKAALEMIGGRL